MSNILIVDSDTNAGQEACQALAAERPDWTVEHADSGSKTLQLIAAAVGSKAIDVIVCEANLKDMASFDLLEQIRVENEQTIRLTLTANADTEAVLGNARANQRFLLKPFCAAHLATTIERSMRLRQSMQADNLKKYMSSVSSIPAIPAIYDQMMQELSSPHSSLLKVGEIVESDTGLTLTVLKVVNSAFYGINKRVESVGQAVTLLGVHLIKNITLTTKVFARFDGSTLSASRLSQLNSEAMRIGALCNQFARYARLPRSSVDHCQIAGMMSNVGELVTAVQKQNAVLDGSLSPELVGASILHGWFMPDAVVEAVALQNESPPRSVDIITPLMVLHSIRYLQANFTQTSDAQQEQACRDYLHEFIPEKVVDSWLDAYKAIEQLTADTSSRAA
ncbi:HDOD domain-containing protein [Granulosicoccus sp. 3-233]|uniref:HDOD domain-containing protein n=1 Tax=Granulosicoccus sp. 3-233 TaxID=3417969 RepID=UPI003D3267CC